MLIFVNTGRMRVSGHIGGPIRGPRSVANENAEDIDLSQARAGGWR